MTELSPAQLAAEIHHFIRGYQQMRGLDPEFIYRIHAGSELEAALRISRLQQIAEYLERLQELEGQANDDDT